MKRLLSLLCTLVLGATAHAVTNPPATTITLDDFKLVGDLSGDQAVFTLTGTARVGNSKGGSFDLVNDPLRTQGWNPWFSEWPNDMNFYAFPKSAKPAPKQPEPTSK
jgi:hypothetical protein